MILSGQRISLNTAINQEILKGRAIYGDNNSNERWACVLGEEIGEIHHALNELCLHPENSENIVDNLKYELIQVIAVAIRWLQKTNGES